MAYSKLARRLKFLIASYRRHGIAHVVEVFRQERIRRAYAAAPIPPPTANELLATYGINDGDARTFIERFAGGAAASLPPVAAIKAGSFGRDLIALGIGDQLRSDASAITSGRFEGLGICINEPSGEFDWSRDYGSAHRWPPVPFNRIAYGANDGADVKYPWELSRMYWIGWLGMARHTEPGGMWPAQFVRLLDHWAACNPVNVGVNWAMPMEVGIRGFWLVMGYALFGDADSITPQWWVNYLCLAWAHGAYLEHNLEYFSNLTNHYIANCLGLVALGALFADTVTGQRWLRNGRDRLIAELEHQVLPDGTHYERSVGYHRLVLEMYLAAQALLQGAGLPFGAQAIARLEHMAEFLRDYSPNAVGAPQPTVPQFGDSDNGVLLRLSMDQELYNHHDTLALAGAVLHRKDLLRDAGGDHACSVLLGYPGTDQPQGPSGSNGDTPGPEPALGSVLYPDGGFAVLRGAGWHVVADVGPIGLHGNNDTLAFTVNGTTGAFIIDPGTYCYTRSPRLRNALRSSRAHNAPVLNGTETAEFDGLWRVRHDGTNTRVLSWEHQQCRGQNGTADETLLVAEHAAYDRPPLAARVRRTWQLRGNELRVRDAVIGVGRHQVAVRFAVAADAHIVQQAPNVVVITRPGGEQLTLECSHELAIESGWYSPSYGVAAGNQWITLSAAIAAVAPDGTDQIAYIWRLSSL